MFIRTQVLLSPEQVVKLRRIAFREGRSVAAVIRDAVDSYVGLGSDPRQRGAQAIVALEAPIEDWEIMKAQILRSQLGDG